MQSLTEGIHTWSIYCILLDKIMCVILPLGFLKVNVKTAHRFWTTEKASLLAIPTLIAFYYSLYTCIFELRSLSVTHWNTKHTFEQSCRSLPLTFPATPSILSPTFTCLHRQNEAKSTTAICNPDVDIQDSNFIFKSYLSHTQYEMYLCWQLCCQQTWWWWSYGYSKYTRGLRTQLGCRPVLLPSYCNLCSHAACTAISTANTINDVSCNLKASIKCVFSTFAWVASAFTILKDGTSPLQFLVPATGS